MSGDASAGEFRGGIHVRPVRIYYEDTDFSGIVYHANYLRYLERGRSDCLRLMGIHHHELMALEPPIAWTIIRMEIDFLRPARIDDILDVKTAYTKVTGARLFGSQVITRRDDELIRADIQAACITNTGKPTRIPANIREIISSHVTTLE